MGLQTGTFDLKPYGVVQLYADLLEKETGVRPDLLASGSRGKNLQGGRLIISAIGGVPLHVLEVLEKVIELKGTIPNMMVVAGAVVEASFAVAVEKTASRTAYERLPVPEGIDGWEL